MAHPPIPSAPSSAQLELVDWRRRVAVLYAAVRAQDDPGQAHALWRRGRDELMREHPQSPLLAGDELRRAGVPYWPYAPELRFALELEPAAEPATLTLHTGGSETTALRRIGVVALPAGRYLLDTAKGADLGSRHSRLVIDLNFLYHPSCRYNADWQCPLAPAGNTIAYAVRAGERL